MARSPAVNVLPFRPAHALLTFLSLGVAAYAFIGYALLPLGALVDPDKRTVFQAHPVGIYAHVFGAAVALALGPFQFSTRLRARWPRLHRWSGRFYLGIGVLIGGLAGLFMARHAGGGWVARAGFGLLAIAWLASGVLAWFAIRAGDVATHRRWMVRNFALTLAAVTLRIYLPAALVSGATGDAAYAAIAWLCWVPNLIVAEWLLRRQPVVAAPA